MATKFLKSPNGGIYKDSNGNLVAVEPERVIRDIDGSIPASTLEDISVSTGTASTNGVTYIRASMKGEVTYTDNTHDTINYYIDLPIKAGDGVTIEAQPLEGGTGNKQLVISASGGGTTLNKYTASFSLSSSSITVDNVRLIYKILTEAKGKIIVRTTLDVYTVGRLYYNETNYISIGFYTMDPYGSPTNAYTVRFYSITCNTDTNSASIYADSTRFTGGTIATGSTTSLFSVNIIYENDAEITL